MLDESRQLGVSWGSARGTIGFSQGSPYPHFRSGSTLRERSKHTHFPYPYLRQGAHFKWSDSVPYPTAPEGKAHSLIPIPPNHPKLGSPAKSLVRLVPSGWFPGWGRASRIGIPPHRALRPKPMMGLPMAQLGLVWRVVVESDKSSGNMFDRM